MSKNVDNKIPNKIAKALKAALEDYIFDKGEFAMTEEQTERQKANFDGFYESKEDEKFGLPRLAKYISDIRSGVVYNRKDEIMPNVTALPREISLREAVRELYGVSLHKFFLGMDIDLRRVSLLNLYGLLGGNANTFNIAELQDLCLNYSAQSFTSTRNVPNDFRFILAEIILDAVNVAFEYSAMHNNWVAMTTPLTQTEAKMPFIKDGDTMPKFLEEGESIPIGSIAYGQKGVVVKKLGIGISLTDELIKRSSINFLQIFLRMVGYKLAMASDNFAMYVLINGEQTGNTEAAYVAGVTTANSYDYASVDDALMAMEQARFTPDIAIGRRADMRFELSTPERPRETLKQYLSKEGLKTMLFPLPANNILFIDSQNAMTKLTFGTQTFERQRDASVQKETFYMTMFIGFASIRKDARLILNNTVTTGIPSAYDAETYIASQTFKN